MSMRPMPRSLRLGLALRVVIVFEGVTGTNCKTFVATGLMQLGLTVLFATQGLPEESVKGWPVRVSAGLVRLPGGRSLKSPLRCAAVGSLALLATDSGRSRKP